MSDVEIGLAEAIKDLRHELNTAMEEGEGSEVKFEVGSIDLEFVVELKKGLDAGAKVRWCLVSGDARGSVSSMHGHKVRIVLAPKSAATRGPLEVSR